MNKDEKNISVGKDEAQASPEAPKASEAKKAPADKKPSGFAAWWNKTGTGVKAAIIAAIALVVIIPVILIFTLGGEGGFGGATVGGGANQKTSYSITFTTQGGMAISGKPVYIYEYSDGSLGNLVTGGYASTDENGKAVFSLPKNGSFAAQITLPDGYDASPFYPLVSKEMDIRINTAVIPESSLAGVSYELGDVIRDFTVTTTEGKTFTLSEVLKTKRAVLINFWYDGCVWCETEFPLMVEAYEKYSDYIAIIALDPIDDMLTIRSFKSEFGLTFDVAPDTASLAAAFDVGTADGYGFPTSIMVDRYGVIAMLEPGAITSERVFDIVFDHFTADNYEQKLIADYEDIVPKEKPTATMPSSDEMSQVFDGGLIEDVEYLPYPSDATDDEKEYSWPFVNAEIEDGEGTIPVIMPSNAGKESSYAQLIVEIPLKAGEALAFDYYSSTELGADILYIVVDGKDIYSISGESTEWETCYAYVAEEDATYEVGFVYTKDSSDNVGDDTVYLKNLRIVSVDDVDRPTYIYRFAATNPDNYGLYADYVEIYLGSDDYFHVDSENGPILLANLMGYTRLSEETTAYYMVVDYLDAAQQLYDDKKISASEFEEYQRKYDRIVQYCSYASNASIYGVCSVNEELMELLIELTEYNGVAEDEKGVRWLQLCCYYDSYGTDKELEDPIKGLAPFSAYEAVLSATGSNEYPNSIVYDRMIMPRGLFYKFTPSKSGTYLVTSRAPGSTEGSFIDCEGWIFVKDNFESREAWYTYANVDRNNIGYTGDMSNVYMLAYFEAGKDYYINVAYADVYQEGTINFRVEYLGGEGVYRFSLASLGYYSSLINSAGELTETISGGIELELGDDGYWREARTDGREGSLLYADFEKPTGMFDFSIKELIEMGAFNLATNENDEYILAIMKSNQAYNYYLDLCLKDLWGGEYEEKYEEYKVDDVLSGIYHGTEDKDGNPTISDNDQYILDLRQGMKDNETYNNDENLLDFLKSYWGEDSYDGYMEEYQVEDVLMGKYHGTGEDYTDEISAYLDKVIKQGDNDIVGKVFAGDERIGCVVVDEQLAELLQVIMYKYSFEGVENSWAKLCYYHQYFCAATPN